MASNSETHLPNTAALIIRYEKFRTYKISRFKIVWLTLAMKLNQQRKFLKLR